MRKQATQYKQTEIGLLPSHWEVIQLINYGETYTGLSGKNKDNFGFGQKYIPYLNVFNNTIIKNEVFDLVEIKENENQSKVIYGDLVFTTSSETPEEVGMSSVFLSYDYEPFLNSFCFGYRLNDFKKLDPLYLSILFRSDLGRRIIYKLAQGATRYNISKSGLLKTKLPIPPLPEQQRISTILSTWDIAIENCKSTLVELLKLKKWLASELLNISKSSSKRKRIQLIAISKLVDRVKNSFIPELDKNYKQIGIRSHCKGIFYKEEVSGKALGNKSVFHIEPNCFIVNIVFAWEHAIAKTTENEIGMIASHRFPMYKPKEGILDLGYMLHYFKSKKGKDLLELASPGGAGRNKTLGQSEFLKLQIPVPSFDTQIQIAEILDKADYEIVLHKQKLEQLQLQKKGLMQQLLTGKIITI